MRRSKSRWRRRPTGASEKIWDTKANNHNAMFDGKGRVWFAAAVRGRDNPAFCKKGSDHPSAKVFPLEQQRRQLAILDPKTMKYTFVDTCFQTHHLQFGYDANNTLWTSGGGPVVGWVNTKMFDETGDAAKAQGWTPFVLDTNGNGKRDDYAEPDQPMDPAKDMRVTGGSFYAVMPSPADGSIWGAVGVFGGAVVRSCRGQSARDRAGGDVQRADAGLRHARRRYRQQGRRVGIARAAATSAASTGASARARSTVRRRPATMPRRLGVLQYPGPGFEGSARTAPSRATTAGSTSTTRSGSARTCRCRPATSTTA